MTTDGAAPSAERHRERAREIDLGDDTCECVPPYVTECEVHDAIAAALARVEAETLELAARVADARAALWRGHGGAGIAFPWTHLTVEGECDTTAHAIRALASEGRSPEAPEIVQGAPETGGLAPDDTRGDDDGSR